MDEPTSALDLAATEAIEHRILALRETRAVILVTTTSTRPAASPTAARTCRENHQPPQCHHREDPAR